MSLLQANFTVHMDRFPLWQFSVGISVNSFVIHGGSGNGRDDRAVKRAISGCKAVVIAVPVIVAVAVAVVVAVVVAVAVMVVVCANLSLLH